MTEDIDELFIYVHPTSYGYTRLEIESIEKWVAYLKAYPQSTAKSMLVSPYVMRDMDKSGFFTSEARIREYLRYKHPEHFEGHLPAYCLFGGAYLKLAILKHWPKGYYERGDGSILYFRTWEYSEGTAYDYAWFQVHDAYGFKSTQTSEWIPRFKMTSFLVESRACIK